MEEIPNRVFADNILCADIGSASLGGIAGAPLSKQAGIGEFQGDLRQ
jgi:hypothetical protein